MHSIRASPLVETPSNLLAFISGCVARILVFRPAKTARLHAWPQPPHHPSNPPRPEPQQALLGIVNTAGWQGANLSLTGRWEGPFLLFLPSRRLFQSTDNTLLIQHEVNFNRVPCFVLKSACWRGCGRGSRCCTGNNTSSGRVQEGCFGVRMVLRWNLRWHNNLYVGISQACRAARNEIDSSNQGMRKPSTMTSTPCTRRGPCTDSARGEAAAVCFGDARRDTCCMGGHRRLTGEFQKYPSGGLQKANNHAQTVDNSHRPVVMTSSIPQ